jgi:hypothetical protein
MATLGSVHCAALAASGLRAAAILGSILAAGLPAAADSTYCQLNHAPGTPGFGDAYASGSWLCADAGTSGGSGWEPMVVAPDAAGTAPVSAAQTGSAGGSFAASASANASAEPGLLRAQAAASTFGTPGGSAYSGGATNATFLERGTLAPLGGAASGAPVDLRLTIDVGGSFSISGAGGDGQVTVFRNGTVAYQRSLFVAAPQPTFFEEVELPGFVVGDEIGLWMWIYAHAGATDAVPNADSSAADMGFSGHLYLDVPSGNAVFESTSGHDYSAVPEPSAPLLLGVGAFVLAASSAGRRRRPGRGLPLSAPPARGCARRIAPAGRRPASRRCYSADRRR